MTNWKRTLLRLGLKQQWVARKMHVSQTLLSYWVNGKRPWPDDKREEFERILAAYGIT